MQSEPVNRLHASTSEDDRDDGATLSDATLSLSPRPEGDSAIPEALRVRGDRKYRIGGIVARGGMGTILDAHESATQRHVAMKIMAEKTASSDVSRFVQEAQITANLEHPNIVPVHELSLNEQDQPFYTMKLVRGISLKKVLEMLSLNDPGTRQAYPLSVLLTIFQKVCDAVAFAHSKGILHRDLKPDNIMLGEYGEALVMDWGLAKKMGEPASAGPEPRPAEPPILTPREGQAEGSASAGSTLVGTVMGTPQFMSPEQAWGETDRIDGRTDIYSLGAILYQLLVLKPPFEPSKNPEETLNAVRKGRVVPLATAAGSKRLPHLPGGSPDSLAAVAMKALALDPGDRYARVTDLQQEIASYQNGFATRAEGASAWRLLSLFVRRHRNLSIAAAVLLLSAVIFTVNIAHQKRIANVQRNVAEDRLYLSHLLQASGAIQGSDPESAYDLLAQHRDEGSKRELRGWEWYYLLGQLNQDRLRVAHAHEGGAFTLAASNDGSRLASGGGDGYIAVWKTVGFIQVQRIHAHHGAVLAVAWDASGKRIASGGEDGLVCIWDVETGEKLASLSAPSRQPVRLLAWDPSDASAPSLAFGGSGFDVMLCHPLASGAKAGPESLFATTHGITCLDWSADGRRLAFAELDSSKGLLVLDVASRQPLISFNGTVAAASDISAVAIDPGGQYVAIGSKHSFVSIFEIETGREIFTSSSIHRGIVNALAWSPDGKQLASASQDCTIHLTARPSLGAPAKEQEGPAVFASYVKSFNAIVWTRLPGADGDSTTAIFSAATDGAIRAWSFQREAEASPLDGWIAAAHWSPDGRWIAAADFQRVVHIIDPATGLRFPLWPANVGLHDVQWSPNGDRVATAGRVSGQVEIMDQASGKPLAEFSLPGADRVAWSASGEFLAASSRVAPSSAAPPGVHVWNTASGKEIRWIPQSASSLLWSRDNRHLLVGQTDGSIRAWDVLAESSSRALRPPSPPLVGGLPSEVDPPRMVCDLAYSPDEKRLAFVTQDGTAALLDSGDGKLVRKFAESLTPICCVTWSPDGRRIATTGKDGLLRLYSPEDGGQMLQIQHGNPQSENGVQSLDWSRDGWRILTGGHDGVVRVWNAERGRQVDAVEAPSTASPLFRDPSESPKMEKTFAHLGWVDQARDAYKSPSARAAGGGPAAEEWFSHALSSSDPIEAYFDPALRVNRQVFSLLNSITTAWGRNGHLDEFVESDWETLETAVKNYRDLSALPQAAGRLPLAQRYFSRGDWTVTWFPVKAESFQDAPVWRQFAEGSGATIAREPGRVSFPYHGQGPRSLGINRELTAHGPEAANCGMIATTKMNLPVGKWRLQVEGDGGARVLVDGAVLIDAAAGSASGVHFRDYEQAERKTVSIIVEQSVAAPSSGFEFLLFPLLEK